MKIKASELKEGMTVVHVSGKGILTIEQITTLESFPEQYRVQFYGIAQAETFKADDELQILEQGDRK